MAEKLDSNAWRVRWRQHGRRFSKTFPNKELALKYEASLKLDQARELLPNNDASSQTFSEFAERWLKEFCEVEKAETQWREDKRVIGKHLNTAFGSRKLSELRKNDLIDLRQKLRLAKKSDGQHNLYKPKTINNILGLAKKMLNTAVEWNCLSSNPFSEVKKLKLAEQDFDFWTPDERDDFITRCNEVDSLFSDVVTVACHTGLRLGELAGLEWRAVDFQRRRLSIKNTFNYKLKKNLNRTKTHAKAMEVPMNATVWETLVKQKAESKDEFVFPKDLLANATHRLKRLCAQLEVRPIRFHDLRHTFASCLAMAGVDLMIIKELMRHASYQMTLRYAHLHPNHLTGATDVLCSRGPKVAHAQSQNFSAGPRLAHENKKGNVLPFPSSR